MPRKKSRLPLAAAITAALLAALATTLSSVAQDDHSSSPQANAGSGKQYAAMERAQRAGDQLPPGVLKRFGPDNARGPKVDAKSSRKVARVDKSEIFLATGPESFCTISVAAGGWTGGCTSKQAAASGEPQVSFDFVESADGNDMRTWGVAPDGVRDASVVTSDGSRVDGAFDVTTDDPPASFVWTSADGAQHTEPVPLPGQ